MINYKYKNVRLTGIKKGKFGIYLEDERGNKIEKMEFIPVNERKKLCEYININKLYENEKTIYFKPVSCMVKFRN